MNEDARFEEGAEASLNLVAMDDEDMQILSSLVQDAVFPITEMRWLARDKQLVFLVNRFRWEDTGRARHGAERVQALLVVENVLGIASQGIDRKDSDTILQLLSAQFEPGQDIDGHVTLTLAGDGAIRARVEALEVRLRDVTRPYRAPSGLAPDHEI
ncbi:MAG: DUF2948 family protein [Pseudomonadota bacterium]